MSERSVSTSQTRTGPGLGLVSDRWIVAAYYLTLTLFLAAAFIPGIRDWGINWWAYYPVYVPIVLFVIGAAAPLALLQIRLHEGKESRRSSRFWLITVGIVVIFGLLFVFLRARTHFLGDGYLMLTMLADGVYAIKNRELGESLAHIWVRDLLGGTTGTAARLSYQVISTASGVVFAAVAAYFSRAYFKSPMARVVFLLGMLSGGYVLLFFGYVENYSLFVLSVGVYVLLGIAVTEKGLSRWWLLLPQAAAVFFHVLGVTLLPATVYLLFTDTALYRRCLRWSLAFRMMALSLVLASALAVLVYFYFTDMFFRLAVLPITRHEFTVPGYMLLSWRHLIDFTNLLILLSPGLIVFVIAVSVTGWRSIRQVRSVRFLIVSSVCTLGAVFIFDPKLGMPRDWDLFAFAGVPLTALVFWVLLRSRPARLQTATLITALGFLVLGPRVVGQVVDEIALGHARHYKDLDVIKSRNFYHVLIRYHREHGNGARAEELLRERNRRYPEQTELPHAVRLLDSGRYREAITAHKHLIDRNPLMSDAWSNLGQAYYSLGKNDSAIVCFEIARALNPGTAIIPGKEALVYIKTGELEKAEELLDQALKRDSSHAPLYYGKARIAQKRNDYPRFIHHLEQAVAQPNAVPLFARGLLVHYLRRGEFSKAKVLLEQARSRGLLDSALVDSVRAAHPELR